MLRRFEVGQPYIHTPIVPGIECVGEIADASDSDFRPGERVITLMGGMGRSFDGSYADYVLAPVDHVFAVRSDLSNEELAAVPETYFTAYGSLKQSLQLSSGELLLVRGGTSTVGLAAIQLGKALGAYVVATTRSPEKTGILLRAGADAVVLDGEQFNRRFLEQYPHGADKALELIGASTLRSILRLTKMHGIVCHTGLLGGIYALESFDPIKEIPSGVYLTGFYSNAPERGAIEGMMYLMGRAGIRPIIARIFDFENIAEAHALAEIRAEVGKIVVRL